MKILILDDMPARHEHFKEALVGDDLTHVYSADECISALRHFTYNWVYLDHDLRESHYTTQAGIVVPRYEADPDKYESGTGMDVVDFIVKHPGWFQVPKTKFHIHSWNTIRAREMCIRLKEVGLTATQGPASV